MYFVFKDLFGNNLYDAVVNDTAEISDALYLYPNATHCMKIAIAQMLSIIHCETVDSYQALRYVKSMIA